MVAEGQIDDPAPRPESQEAALYIRDFFRLSKRAVSVGFGSAAISVGLNWKAVLKWAKRYEIDGEEALKLMYMLRDERERLENQFLQEKK